MVVRGVSSLAFGMVIIALVIFVLLVDMYFAVLLRRYLKLTPGSRCVVHVENEFANQAQINLADINRVTYQIDLN